MKITIEAKILLALLTRCKAVAMGASPLPAANCFLLTAKADELELTTCNGDLQIRSSIPCGVIQPGAVAINANRLFEAVSKFGPGELTIAADPKNTVTISRGESTVTRLGLPADEMMSLRFTDGSETLVIPQKRLGNMLRKVMPFASTDETRFVLNGVAITSRDNQAAFVAIDGRRLRAEWCDSPPIPPAILPSASVSLVASLCGNGDSPVALSVSESLFTATSSDWHITGKLIEGNYPNWQQVIPAKVAAKYEIAFPREKMISALALAMTTTNAKGEINSLKLSGDRGTLAISANVADVGSSEVDVPGGHFGVPKPVAYQGVFLSEMAQSFDGEEIIMRMASECDPAIIENQDGLCVIIPIRIA